MQIKTLLFLFYFSTTVSVSNPDHGLSPGHVLLHMGQVEENRLSSELTHWIKTKLCWSGKGFIKPLKDPNCLMDEDSVLETKPSQSSKNRYVGYF